MALRKRRFSREKLIRYTEEVKAQLREDFPDFDLELVTEAVIADVLRWPGTQREIDDDGKIIHIARYLPRNLRRLSGPGQAQRVLRPEKLDPASAVAYAVALYLRPLTEPIIQNCRRHYWQSSTPPFPWLLDHSNQYQSARESAYTWLKTEGESEGSGKFNLTLAVRVPHSQAAKNRLDYLLTHMAENESWHHAGLPLTTLLRELADAFEESEITGRVLLPTEYPVPRIDLEWSGAVLNIYDSPRRSIPVRSGGPLVELHKAVRALTSISFWWTEAQALEYILLGHPPKPKEDQLQRYIFADEAVSGGKTATEVYAVTARRTDMLSFKQRRERKQKTPTKRRKPLSDTHLALLQLAFLQPDAMPPERLDQWDAWCQLEEYKLRLASFRGDRGGVPYSRSGRLTQFRRESDRALKRALSFQPLPVGIALRIQQ